MFGHGQNAFESNDEKIADQVRMNILRPAAHIILFKARDTFAYCRFDFALSLHIASFESRNSKFYLLIAACLAMPQSRVEWPVADITNILTKGKYVPKPIVVSR